MIVQEVAMIKINNLHIKTQSNKELVNLSFNIDSSCALVGESGSGKSLTLKAILNMLPSNLKHSIDISAPFVLKRGDSVSFVPQNPFTALSPLTKISKQFFAPKSRVLELFNMLNLEERLYNEYPPNLSGGQLQRVIFAISLVNSPKLLLLDEPTTALDSDIRLEMINSLKLLQKELKFSMLFVTHEIELAASLCEDIVILKKGKVVESGKSKDIIANPKEPYSKLLIESNFANREFRV
jgi:peptide/nickel transport system ATP-binding protein